MNARELIADLRLLGPQDPNVVFHYLAARVYDARLSNGLPLHDAHDFKLWLEELGEASKCPALPADHTCPDCGHVHEDRNECKKYLGEGKFCPCESRVTA
jgi:hypothetical protein